MNLKSSLEKPLMINGNLESRPRYRVDELDAALARGRINEAVDACARLRIRAEARIAVLIGRGVL